jgi:hypothetical protein
VTVGEGEFASTGTEAEAGAEAVRVGGAELVGPVVAGVDAGEDVAGAVGLGVVADGDVVGVGAREAGDGVAAGVTVVAGVTYTVAAGDGLTSR